MVDLGILRQRHDAGAASTAIVKIVLPGPRRPGCGGRAGDRAADIVEEDARAVAVERNPSRRPDKAQRVAERSRRRRRRRRRPSCRSRTRRLKSPSRPRCPLAGTPIVSASCVVSVRRARRRQYVDRRAVIRKADVAAQVDDLAVGRGVAVAVGDRRRRRQAHQAAVQHRELVVVRRCRPPSSAWSISANCVSVTTPVPLTAIVKIVLPVVTPPSVDDGRAGDHAADVVQEDARAVAVERRIHPGAGQAQRVAQRRVVPAPSAP